MPEEPGAPAPFTLPATLTESAQRILSSNAAPAETPDADRAYADELRWLLSEVAAAHGIVTEIEGQAPTVQPGLPGRGAGEGAGVPALPSAILQGPNPVPSAGSLPHDVNDPYAPDADGHLSLRGQNLGRVPEGVRRHAARLRRLDLARTNLTHLPDWIGELSELEELIVWETPLANLPPGFARLGKLRKLDITANALRELPPLVRDLAGSLRELYFDRNPMTEVPEWVAEMTDLEGLGIGNGPLERVPPETLGKLTNLRWLVYTGHPQADGGGVRLTEVPEWVTALTDLEELNLGNHRLSDLPESFTGLSRLSVLKLWNNAFTEIPLVVFGMANLAHLDMAMNQVAEIPPEIANLTNLRNLSMGSNRLSDLPPQIGELQRLEVLHLDLNRFASLPDVVFQLQRLNTLHIGNNRDFGGSSISDIPPGIARLSRLADFKIDHGDGLNAEQRARLAGGGARAVRDHYRDEQRGRLSGRTVGLVRPPIAVTEVSDLIDLALHETGCNVKFVGAGESLTEIDAVVIQGGGQAGEQVARQAAERGIPVLPLAWSGPDARRAYAALFPKDVDAEAARSEGNVPVYSDRAYGDDASAAAPKAAAEA